jgi:hypothetical protein
MVLTGGALQAGTNKGDLTGRINNHVQIHPIAAPNSGSPLKQHLAGINYNSSSARSISALGDPADVYGSLIAAANYVQNSQSGTDGGWDWTIDLPAVTHSANPSETNLYGVSALGLYYAYEQTNTASYKTAMKSAADASVANALVRDAAVIQFLMLYNDISGVTGTAYKDAAKAKYDADIAAHGGTAALFAAWLRDDRGITQGYHNGIITWDLGAYAVAAEMLYARYGGSYHNDAVDIANVMYGAAFTTNANYFDLVRCAGWDPAWSTVDYWWYNLGVSGLVDAFYVSGAHATEIPGLVTKLLNSQASFGGFCGSYGVHASDDDWQTTAYVVMSLHRVNPTTYASVIKHAAYYMAGSQDASGGWAYGSTVYPEVVGECASALYFGIPSVAPVTSANIGTTINVSSDVKMKFTALPPGTNATLTIEETPVPPPGVPAPPLSAGTVAPLYLQIDAAGLTNGTFSVTVTIDVSAIANFSSTTLVMYYSTASSSWVGISGTYNAGAHTFTFTTDHFTPFAFVNPLNPDDLYLSTSSTDNTKNIFYPQATGTIYGADDWSYSPMVVHFYVEPRGTQSFAGMKFTIHCDPTMGSISYYGLGSWLLGNWNVNTQLLAPGALQVEVANLSPTINHMPTPPDRLGFTVSVTKPGYNPITLDGIDFRYFVAGPDTQAGVYVTSHPGAVKFYLGDVATTTPASVTAADGLVNFDDLVPWSLSYWSKASDYPSTMYKAKYDVGPTNLSGAYFAMPTPDGQIEFEDLMIFAIGYGKSGAGMLPKETAKPVTLALGSAQNTGTETRVPIMFTGTVSDVRGISMVFNYSSSSMTFKGVEKAGEMNNNHSFMIAKAKNGKLMIDGAVLGLENNGLSHAGVVAYAMFTGKGTVGFESAKARSSANSAIEVKYEKGMTQSNAVPEQYALAQNYPNPFNPATTIHYALAKAGHVEVVIYNMLGEVIATLVNGEQNAGYYDVTWNGQNDKHQTVASGIYLYRMRSGDFVDVQKMVLMK